MGQKLQKLNGQKLNRVIPAIVAMVCATVFSLARANAKPHRFLFRSNSPPNTSW